jgi:branched-chain amino acid transport system substrate-binding protein
MVRTRRYGVAALLTAVVLALAACSEEEPSSSQGGGTSGPIKVGAVLDITGAGASLGVPERKTLELLTKQTNDGGGVNGRQLQLIIEDNQSDEATAAKAMNKLVSQDKVDLVIGATRTGTSLAMKPIAESSKMPMISLAANKKIVDGATWVYKTAQNDQVVLENMIDLARQRGWKTIGLARDASAFGEGVQETLTQLGSGDGIKVVRTEKFAPDATDFTAQMVNLREAGADVNIIWGIPPAVALAQKAYRQLGIKAPVLQSHGIGNQVFLETAGASADGLIAPLGRLLVADQLPADDPQKQVLQRFIDSYSGAYAGERPSTFAGHAYDAFQLALEAFKAAGTDKQGVRDHLEQVKNLPLITGVFTMTPQDHSGLTKEALVLVTVDGQKWRLVPGS